MQELRQIESAREVGRMGCYFRDEQMFVVSGEVLNAISKELQKGDRARWLIEELVNLGATEPVQKS